ncbi:developmentally regulated gtp-binding protein-related [Holotrichia oblita]|nr:developmentally regulated gtp-binding protein-related [Holotrichia oblita]
MFVDKVKIKVKAGKGGDGAISFLREKYRPNGGPAGGDGGRGGSIYFISDSALNTLMDFKYLKGLKAVDGENGKKKHQYGKGSPDIISKVPVGTIVKDAKTGVIIADFTENNQKILIAKGGRGGRGNAKFSSSVNQAPRIAENGELGEDKEIIIELMLLADVGLIGLPNAGKTSLLNALSNAKAIVADYPFTTLVPNLGIVRIDFERSFILADLPGLVEGASSGKGLGLEFLRHIERCLVLIHVLDSSSEDDLIADFRMIEEELKIYNLELLKRPRIIVLNKIDLLDNDKNIEKFKKSLGSEFIIIPTSAYTKVGLDELLNVTYEKLINAPKFPIGITKEQTVYDLDVEEKDFTITHPSSDKWVVSGGRLEKIFQKINLSSDQGVNFLMMIVKDMGIEKELIKQGIKDGDEVQIVSFVFEYFS